MKKPSLLLFLSLLSLQLAAQKADYSALEARLQTELNAIKELHQTPGVTYSAVLPDNHLIALASGLSDLEKKTPMTPKSRMLGGSTGKVFYSVVIMQLVEEGKIDLDEPVSKHLGSYD